MSYYFAVFLPTKEGRYAIEFPDIPEALSQGDDLPECMHMAADALAICAEEYAKARKQMPPPSSLEEVEAWAERQNEDEDLLPGGKMLLQLFKAPEADMTPVKISISLPKSTLAVIDDKARQAGLTRSGFLSTAALAYGP
jgi:predicted RNase H-like HicB family nuclease